MDIVLLKDVKDLGAQGAIVTVKPGYARNYLIPNGLAAAATGAQLAAATERQRRQEQQVAQARAQAEALKRTLESRPLTLTLAMGEGNKSFGSITAQHIVDALAHGQVSVERHAIHLEQPIKALGTYEIPVRVLPDVTAIVKVSVVKA